MKNLKENCSQDLLSVKYLYEVLAMEAVSTDDYQAETEEIVHFEYEDGQGESYICYLTTEDAATL